MSILTCFSFCLAAALAKTEAGHAPAPPGCMQTPSFTPQVSGLPVLSQTDPHTLCWAPQHPVSRNRVKTGSTCPEQLSRHPLS